MPPSFLFTRLHFDPNFACSRDSASAACRTGPGGSISPAFRAWGRAGAGQYSCGLESWRDFRDAEGRRAASRLRERSGRGREDASAARNDDSAHSGALVDSALYSAASIATCEVGDLTGRLGELRLPPRARDGGAQRVQLERQDVLYSLPRADRFGSMAEGGVPVGELVISDEPVRAIDFQLFARIGVTPLARAPLRHHGSIHRLRHMIDPHFKI